LCVLFSSTVMCVDDVPAAGAPPGLFSRGQRRPLFAGAASKVILAHLPPHQLRALFDRHRVAIAAAALGADWDAFRTVLRAIRNAGHCVTIGEFRPGILGIAAPLFNAEGEVLGSLGIAAQAHKVAAKRHRALATIVAGAAKEACARIAQHQLDSARPARSV
jgi:DNA-binding IclR family transcriptional regulator